MTVQQVIEFMSALRQLVGSRPLVMFLGMLAVLSVLRMGRPARERPQPRRWALVTLATAAVTAYAIVVVWYVLLPQYGDPAEPSVAAVAWLFDVGRPVYHAVDSAERYAHMYGPLAFVIPGWCLALIGPGIVTSKIPGGIAGFLSVAVVFALARAAGGTRCALLFAGLFAGLCLMFESVSFWIRPDSIELLTAGVALLAVVTIRHDLAAAVALGVATGVLAGLKITGPLYALPAFAVLIAERRILSAVLGAAVGVAVTAAPFVLYSNVSLGNYLHWTATSASNGLVFLTLKQNVEWALFLLIPLVAGLVRPPADPGERWLRGSLVAGMAAVVLAASKPGAGVYHLLPFVPAILYASALTWRNLTPDRGRDAQIRLGATALVGSVALVACLQTTYFVRTATRTRGMSLVQDLERFVRLHPADRIEMGYSTENEALSYVRPVVVFAQGAYLLDAPAVQELQMSGVELPAATIHAVESCLVDLWLIPAGGDPFSLRNRYPVTGHVPLFPESLRLAFARAYHRTASTDYFDVWACRAPAR